MTYTELLDYLGYAIASEQPVNILPTLRENMEHVNPLMDQAIEWDLGPNLFNGGFQGLQGTGCSLDDNKELSITGSEFDIVTFCRLTPYTCATRLLQHAAIILLHDCTGCCNALYFIRVSQQGLVAHGYIGNTYHS